MHIIKEYTVPTLVVVIVALLFTLVLGNLAQNSSLQVPPTNLQSSVQTDEFSRESQGFNPDNGEFDGGSFGALFKVAILMGIPGLITVAVLNRGRRSKIATETLAT